MSRLTLFLVCFLLSSVASAHALRCNGSIVSKGDFKPSVLHKCGEPDFIEHLVIYETVSLDPHTHRRRTHTHQVPFHNGALKAELPLGHQHLIAPKQVQDFTYNFGPHRLMQRLRFIDGRLRKIHSLGYGY